MKNEQKFSTASIKWLFKMAWRDGKASIKKLRLFMASIILGIAAVVSIQSFSENLKSNIAVQSKSLMGSDFKIDSNKAPNEAVMAIMDSLVGFNAREINFPSMAAFPNKEGSKLVQVRGIEGSFPFYGELETEPKDAANIYQLSKSALLDATVMLQLNLKVGDSVKIGAITLPIAGALKSAPGSNAIFSTVAPPIVIPFEFIEASGLVQTGSRINYEFYFVANPEMDLSALNKAIGKRLDAEEADLDIHTTTSERLGRRYDNFGRFLNLVAFIALLLGCVGIASAIHIYIKEKLRSVALLKCLGATKRQTFIIYLIQIAVIGLLGGLIGSALGVVLQHLFPVLLEGLLPVDVEITLAPNAIIMGVLLGVFMSVLFALYPLMGTIYISPLQALRIDDNPNSKSLKAGIFVLIGIFSFIFLFSYWLLKDLRYASAFLVGLIVTFLILAGTAHLFMKAIKRFFPSGWGFIPRTSLLNLYRPQNQTLILVLAIGVGSFLISTLYFSKDLLLVQANMEAQENTANMILLDVQVNQQNDVASVIRDNNHTVIDNIPIVTMRIHSIGGKLVNAIKEDSTSTINRWVLNHEFRVTYRDVLIESETLEQGEFTSKAENLAVIPISVSDNLARDVKLEIGDELVFNVQGVLMKTIVGSIRTVDWSRMQLNFTVLFPTGVLEGAPQFRVLTTQVPDEMTSARLQQQLVRQFPNISVLDLRQILLVIENLLNKIVWIINFMAFFSILTGVIVLLGAVRTSKHQRIKESVLLRTIGAKSHQILKMIALEYIYLGILGSLTGIILSLVSSQLLALWIFEMPFSPSIIPFVVLFPGITALVLVIGLTNSISVIKNPPLQVIRCETT